MKITIRFKHNYSFNYPCAALVNIFPDEPPLCAIGKTWDEVKAEVLGKVKAASSAGSVPEPVEVEI